MLCRTVNQGEQTWRTSVDHWCKIQRSANYFLFCEDNLDCNPKKKLKSSYFYSSFCLHRTNIEKKCNIITVKPWCCLWIKHTSFLSNSESIYRWTIYLIFCVLNWSCIRRIPQFQLALWNIYQFLKTTSQWN